MLKTISILFIVATAVSAKTFILRVEGVLLCDSKNYTEPAEVLLYDRDMITQDDELNNVTASEKDKGVFKIDGEESGFRRFDPYLSVTHNCKSKDNITTEFDLGKKFVVPKDKEEQIQHVKLELSTGKLV
ncbi:unnamed protein product [Bursaphelenchus okinawaensis]|uniref:Uncharacterized protein n=1 Tax=Bursaphelenchus okinawaensis TaxID=465554 RepID=A0A811KCU5_9BILA|nr:unnamed protein product [Bursaphelenchus okinawaensis]CAG9101864.1 unnamed protein product [Bursaphelenchus okinawaensis]